MSKKSAEATTFTVPYILEAEREFVVYLGSLLHEHHQVVRSSDVVEKPYLGEYLRCIVPD